jgi:hypothetical protein
VTRRDGKDQRVEVKSIIKWTAVHKAVELDMKFYSSRNGGDERRREDGENAESYSKWWGTHV